MESLSAIWRHVKTGGLYTIIMGGHSEVENEADGGETFVVIYRSLRDGRTWARPASDFFDGRFENLTEKQASEL